MTLQIETGERYMITGRHVFLGMVVFFGCIFAVNGVFLYHALRTHSGVETQDAYRRGLAYNTRVAAGREQDARAWKSVVAVEGKELHIALTDRLGKAVRGLAVSAVVGRPATDRHDRHVALREHPATGTYRAKIAPLEPGRWLVKIEASARTQHGRKVVYRMQRRLWQKP